MTVLLINEKMIRNNYMIHKFTQNCFVNIFFQLSDLLFQSTDLQLFLQGAKIILQAPQHMNI